MQRKWLPAVILGLCAAMVAHAGCGGSSSPNVQPTVIPVTPQSASTTVPLTANAQLSMPTVAGVAGTFEESTPVVSGAMVALTSYSTAPNNAPQPLSTARISLGNPGGAPPSLGTAIFLVSQVYSEPMTFASFPSTTWQLPSRLLKLAPFELELIDGTSGTLLDTEYQLSSPANPVSFAGTSSPFVTVAGHTYWWELISGFASPPPSGCGSNATTVTLVQAGLTVAEPVLCNFTGSVQISGNSAPSGTSMAVSSLVPALQGALGPPAPAGTTTGVLSVSLEVSSSSVTFDPGLLQFAIRLPSSMPAGTKRFVLSACTIKASSSGGGPLTYQGCIDTPYTSGDLPIAGQTVSFAGLPSSLTLPASASLRGEESTCFKLCTPPPNQFYYLYTVSLFY